VCTGSVPTDGLGNVFATSSNPFFVDTATSGNLINAVKAPPGLGTTGGWTPVHITGLINAVQAIKTSGGQLGFMQCDNIGNAFAYVQVFNASTGSVTLGVTPPTQTLPIPAALSNGFTLNLVGLQYSTAISVAATSTDNGGSAPGSPLNCTFGYN
jgi:hypothetical protein